jgi:hypothetical protein
MAFFFGFKQFFFGMGVKMTIFVALLKFVNFMFLKIETGLVSKLTGSLLL